MTAPQPCPRCGGPMGDGDRVTAGICALCRRPPIPRPRQRPTTIPPAIHILEEVRRP